MNLKHDWKRSEAAQGTVASEYLNVVLSELVVYMFGHLKRTDSMAVVEKELHIFILHLDSHSHL